ncbi:tetratricopeptide repeat protein [Sorangium sp. So ce1000]|uniref:tetratricopeptide repeat protein n=1 Tax=Sorangium sp. So ce1000 TaxID=3133325 RepID=UPI003F6109CF
MLLRRCVPFAAALFLLLPTGEVRAQSDQDRAAARSLATQGAEAFTSGRFEEAIDLLGRAEALVHAPTHLLLIARAQARLGRLVAAKETYLRIVREELPPAAPSPFKRAQQDAREELAAIEPRIASLRIALEGAAGRKIGVKLDGQPVADALLGVHRPIDPGNHVVTVVPPGLAPIEQGLTIGDGERKELKIPVPEGPAVVPPPGGSVEGQGTWGGGQTEVPPVAPPGTPERKTNAVMLGGGITATALGLGGIVVGSVFLAKGSGTQKDANDLSAARGCESPGVGGDCGPLIQAKIKALDSDAASQQTIGVIGLIGGGVFLAGGVTLLVLELTAKPEPASSAWIAPYVTPTGLGVRGAF